MTDMSIADRMQAAAEDNLGLPYSLMCDAWDRALTVDVQHTPTRYEGHLIAALDAYEADPVGYQFNPRATETSEDHSSYTYEVSSDHSPCTD